VFGYASPLCVLRQFFCRILIVPPSLGPSPFLSTPLTVVSFSIDSYSMWSFLLEQKGWKIFFVSGSCGQFGFCLVPEAPPYHFTSHFLRPPSLGGLLLLRPGPSRSSFFTIEITLFYIPFRLSEAQLEVLFLRAPFPVQFPPPRPSLSDF